MARCNQLWYVFMFFRNFFYIENFIGKVLRFIQYFINPFCEKLFVKPSITFSSSKLLLWEINGRVWFLASTWESNQRFVISGKDSMVCAWSGNLPFWGSNRKFVSPHTSIWQKRSNDSRVTSGNWLFIQ